MATKQKLKNIESALKKDTVVLLFHAEWCGHCKMFKPEWKKFMSLQKENKGVKVFDLEENEIHSLDKRSSEKLAGDDVVGYPTIAVFTNGKKYLYQGERSAEKLSEHIEQLINEQNNNKNEELPSKKTKQRGGNKMDVGQKLEVAMLNVIKDYLHKK